MSRVTFVTGMRAATPYIFTQRGVTPRNDAPMQER
jgi:hypothetical protein